MEPGELAGAHPELFSARFRGELQRLTGDKKLSAKDFAALARAAEATEDKKYLQALAGKALKTPDSSAFTVPVKPKGPAPMQAVLVDFSSEVTDQAARTLVNDYQYTGRSPAESARLIKALLKGRTDNKEELAVTDLIDLNLPRLTDLVRALRREGLTLQQVAREIQVTVPGPPLFGIPFLRMDMEANANTIADAVLENLREARPADRQALYDALDEKSLAWLRTRAQGELP